MSLISILPILLFFIVIVLASTHIVPIHEMWVIERSGKFYTIWTGGIHIAIPFIDIAVNKVSILNQTYNFNTIVLNTNDDIEIHPRILVDYHIIDAEQYTYKERNPILTIEKDLAKIIRYRVGNMSMTNFMSNLHSLEHKVLNELNYFTIEYGIQINDVKIEDVRGG